MISISQIKYVLGFKNPHRKFSDYMYLQYITPQRIMYLLLFWQQPSMKAEGLTAGSHDVMPGNHKDYSKQSKTDYIFQPRHEVRQANKIRTKNLFAFIK